WNAFNVYIVSIFTSFLRILRQPSSTLFPYTTLFRSQLGAISISQRKEGSRDQRKRSHEGEIECGSLSKQRKAQRDLPDAAEPEVDRKSTRLNSSHVAISYAVFCLKKKNIAAPTTHPR